MDLEHQEPVTEETVPRPARMHADEVDVDLQLARRLIREQFPAWIDLPLEEVVPRGTDNALYRLGEDMVMRLPRLPAVVDTVIKECTWLPRLAPLLPLAVPIPVARGAPGAGYPFAWAIYRWIDGEPPSAQPITDLNGAAADLAAFLTTLQRVDPTGGPPPDSYTARGAPLSLRDAGARAGIAALAGQIDADLATAIWEEALHAPESEGPPVWVHGDLDARNLLARDGRIAAVIDWGCLAVGDAACDVAVAWKLFTGESRAIFRAALGVDDATWARSRGWVLSQAVGVLSYYTMETNPTLVQAARTWLADVMAHPPGD